MTRKLMYQKAVRAINARGCLLVYPLANKAEPLSIWSELFPKSPMRWSWDEGSDNRVSELWRIREELSRSRDVVYVKWFQNRATFFSFDVFVNLLAFFSSRENSRLLVGSARDVLDILREDSPLSTKQLKVAAELQGRPFEAAYNRAMKPLWQNLWIVGFGEFEDSSFPSLGIGSTELLFEDLWRQAGGIKPQDALSFLRKKLGETIHFLSLR